MACCDYPGCGRIIYAYNKDRNMTIKEKAHTVPANQKQLVVQLLNLEPERARKIQIILCHYHFRKDAYSESKSTRLRKDVPFVDLLIPPGSPSKAKRNAPSPTKMPRPMNNEPLHNMTIGALSIPKENERYLNAASTSLVENPKPPNKPLHQNNATFNPSPVLNNLKSSSVSNIENKAKTDFDMKKLRIEATMKHLLKEKEMELKLKASENEAREYKAKLEMAEAELNQKKKEAFSLKTHAETLKKELVTLQHKLDAEAKRLAEAEAKNKLLQEDLHAMRELYKKEQARLKRVKMEKETNDESLQADSSDQQPLEARLIALEQQLKEANERRESELNLKEKELASMKKEIDVLHAENQQLYDANMALNMDIRAYRKLIQLEEQRTMPGSKRRRLDDGCHDEIEKHESQTPTNPTAKA